MKWLRVVIIVILILFFAAALGISYRIGAFKHLRTTTNQQAIIKITVMTATAGPRDEDIVLPGNVTAWHNSTLFARVSGYVVNWLVDIGAHVKAGELLAVIAAPELDAQLQQTQADLKTAEANYGIAHTTAVRWRNLLKTGSVSKQETEEKTSSEAATLAIVASTRANRDRLQTLVNFERIIAPYDGVITSRTTDIGRLINAGSGPVPLFRIEQVNPLRVYVSIPQYYAPRMTPNLRVKLYFTEHPDKIYQARLLDTAQAIDPTTRTLLAQFEVDNPSNELLAGGYTQVHLLLPANPHAVRLPINTLIFRSQGMQIASVDSHNKILFKSITIGRDFGDSVEVVSGLKPGEWVVVNPPDSLNAGTVVQIVKRQS